MMISKHFDREELACKCGECNVDTVDVRLIELLEEIREWADAPVVINSANRCPRHNSRVGGSPNSQHLMSKAADIVVQGKTPHQVYRQVEDWYPYTFGLGSYDTFTHVDVRSKRARWKG